MLTVFTTFFNLVFNTGIIPDEWSQGMISPIYKNKGDKASPDNYRGITILSCFGKLFTAILNNRLNNYLESMNLLCEEQAGFRKKCGTTDHIFNLKCIIDLYLFRGVIAVTGCRKIPHARGGNRTWATGSKGKHSTTSL